MIQETAKSQIKQKLRGTFREESGDTGISLVTDHRGQRVTKRFRRLERVLQLGQIIGCTGPYDSKNQKMMQSLVDL